MFKIPKEEDRNKLLEQYKVLKKTATKVWYKFLEHSVVSCRGLLYSWRPAYLASLIHSSILVHVLAANASRARFHARELT